MALFEIPGLSGVQPLRRFRVNQDHPLAQGLVLASTPAGIFLPKTGYWLPFGALVDTVVSGNLVYGRASMTLPESLTASTCSAVVRLRLESDPGTYPTVGLAQYASGSDNFGFGVSWDDTAGQIAPTARSNNSGFGLSTYAVTPPYEEHVCVTVNGWGGSSGAFYRNAATSGTTATPAGTFANKVTAFILGSDTLRSAYFFLYHRVISRDEDLALYLDPFCFLEEEPIWVPVSAGGSAVTLTVADGTHAHAADGLVLTSSTALSVADATHAHAADATTLVVGSVLTVAEASHAHAADSPTLTAASALAVADATHSHAADNITLSVAGTTNLTVSDALHSHAADALALTSAHALIVADATHAHAVDGLTLTAASVLAIQEALHAHAADNVTLDASGAVNLLLADGLHAHTADGVALTVAAWLTVADALHAHAADNVVLTFGDEPSAPAPDSGSDSRGGGYSAGVMLQTVRERDPREARRIMRKKHDEAEVLGMIQSLFDQGAFDNETTLQ